MKSARPTEPARAGPAPISGGPAGRRSGRRRSLAPAAAAVGVLGGAAFLWRVLTWESAVSPDAWAYTAWGQAVARGERPLVELGATTPKPLGTFLGLLVVPLPPDRGFAVVVALGLGALAAFLFAAAYREGGAVAAAVAVVALAVGAQLDVALAFAYVDVVTSALIVAGIAFRGRLRIAALVVAGLLRPEAWALAAFAGFTETAGSWRRRGAGALVAGAAAPILWSLGDLVLTGDPLGTLHWQAERYAKAGVGTMPWAHVPGELWDGLTREGGAVLAIAGFLGLVVHYVRGRRSGPADPLPLAVVVGWSLLLAFEIRIRAPSLNARYLLPVVAVLALGCGLLVAAIVPSRLRVGSPWPAAAVAAGALVVAVAFMGLGSTVPREMARNEALVTSRPLVESVLACGRLGVSGGRRALTTIPKLAASSRRSLHDFGLYPGGGPFAGVLHATRGSTGGQAEASAVAVQEHGPWTAGRRSGVPRFGMTFGRVIAGLPAVL